MDKWEYKVLELKLGIRKGKQCEEWQEFLNELGGEGWELVSAIIGMTQNPIAFLKRRK